MSCTNEAQSVYCKKCGNNITQKLQHEIDGEKYCGECVESLGVDESYSDNNPDLINEENTQNKIAGILKAMGFTIMGIAFIVGLAIGNESYPFDYFAALVPWCSGVVSGMIFIGFSEIINLLDKIYKQVKVDNE